MGAEEDKGAAIYLMLDSQDTTGIGYMAVRGFGAKCWSGWMEWSGVEWMDGYPLDCYDYQSTCGAKKGVPGLQFQAWSQNFGSFWTTLRYTSGSAPRGKPFAPDFKTYFPEPEKRFRIFPISTFLVIFFDQTLLQDSCGVGGSFQVKLTGFVSLFLLLSSFKV